MPDGARRKRSARFVEIAEEAGVSVATVDRVLNERGSASDAARRKVVAAAQKLRIPRVLPSSEHELIHLDVLLPDHASPFFLRLRAALAAAFSFLDKRFVVHRRILRDADPDAMAQAIARPAYRRRGLIVAAPDTPEVRLALKTASDRGEVVVSVVSHVAETPGLVYFGIDNYRAGKTAGLVMGRFARRPGRVMFLAGRNSWAAHQQRAAGCREVLTKSFPDLQCDAASFETRDDDARCYHAVVDAMQTTALAGIYNSGAGSPGIMQALSRFDSEQEITWISHELSDDHREYLAAGALTMVIDQDPDMQAHSALRYLISQTAMPSEASFAPTGCEFRVYFRENATDRPYLPSSVKA